MGWIHTLQNKFSPHAVRHAVGHEVGHADGLVEPARSPKTSQSAVKCRFSFYTTSNHLKELHIWTIRLWTEIRTVRSSSGWMQTNSCVLIHATAAGHAGGCSSAETTHEVLTDSDVFTIRTNPCNWNIFLLNIRVEKVVLACGECRMGNSILTTNLISLKRHQEKLWR